MTTNFEMQGGEILVNTTTSGDQWSPDIAQMGSGGFVIVWQDRSGQGEAPNPSIKAQIFDSDSNKVGSELLINSVTTFWESIPTVTALQSGGFVVSWIDDLHSRDVKAQIFSADGDKIGGEFVVSTNTISDQIDSDITALASGGFLVTWTDASGVGGDSSAYSVKGQIFDASGANVGGEFLVNTVTSGSQDSSSVAGLASGGFIVTWSDGSQLGGDGSDSAIKAQLFGSDGLKVGTEFLVNVATDAAQDDPAVVPLASGGFVITWTDSSHEGGDPSDSCVKARIYDASGTPLGSEFLVNSALVEAQSDADITALPTGGFLATWVDRSDIGGDGSAGIKAQQFDGTGQKVGTEFLVNTVTASWQFDPTVTSLVDGGIAISWVDEPTSPNGMNIKTQVFAPTSEGPSDISLSTSSVSETAVENLPVATISSAGPLSASFTYSIQSDSTGGAFGIAGDKLIVADNDKLDFETSPTATVTIRSTDNLGNHFDETLVLNVTEVVHEVRYAAGDTFQVSTNDESGPEGLLIATLASGGVVVVWQDWGTDAGVKAQLLDPRGNAIGSEFLASGGRDPAVAAGEAGGFIVCWTSADDTLDGQPTNGTGAGATMVVTNQTGIRAQLFDANGQRVGAEFLVNTQDEGRQDQVTVTGLQGGGYAVVWFDENSGLKAQILDSSGAKIGSEFLISPTILAPWNTPQIESLDTGGFVVTWLASDSVIKAQVFDAGGTKLGSELLVTNGVDDFVNDPVVSPLASGGFVIAWSVPDGNDGSIVKGQIFDAAGVKLGSEFLISEANGEAFQGVPDITSLDSGGFTVTWGYLESRFAQIFDADGNKVGDPILIGSTPYSFAPVVSSIPGDGFAVAWAEWNLGGGFSINSRFFQVTDNRIGTFDVDTLAGDGANNGIYGFAGNDTLNGGAGNDRLDGGAGADAMSGGADNDTYVVDNAGDTVTENADQGTDTVETSLGTGSTLAQRQAAQYQLSANVENLVGTGVGQGLRGNDLDNHITAGSGDDYVNTSNGGTDHVDSGNGRDVIYYGASLDNSDANNAGDEDGDTRGDLLVIQGDYSVGLTLGDGALIDVEKLRILKGENSSFGDTGGNSYSYDITTVDANVAAGARVVVQGGSLQIGEHLKFNGAAETDGSFQMFGGHDSDELIGGAQGDHLLGRAGNDTLTGNGGDDRLRGGLGADTMDGGSGSDIFVYNAQGGAEPYSNAALESTGTGYDTIIGFDFASDKIDLPQIVSALASLGSGALSNASFDADLAAAVDASLGVNGAVLFTADSGDLANKSFLVVDADGDGSYQADHDFVIQLVGAVGTVPTTPDFFV